MRRLLHHVGDDKEGGQAFLEKREPQFSGQVSADMPPFYSQWTNANGGT